MNYRMILYSVGRIVTVLGAVLAIPCALSLCFNEGYLTAYLIPIIISFLIGAAVSIKKPKNMSMYTREGLVIVALSWILISVIGALPFYISKEIPSYIDAVFETASGFTTTGSSILTDIEGMSKSLLFWRSFAHWLGGMGVLVFAMTIFSSKNTRTSYIMRAEMPGPVVGKLVSKWQFSVRILYIMYLVLTAALTVLLMLGGMPFFDSVLHAFGTAGTGGFGIKNSSIGFYDSAYIDFVIGIFMLLFGINFNMFYLILIRKFVQIKENDELKVYLGTIAAAVVIIGISIFPIYKNAFSAFRYSFFQVTSIVSTTGYATADFTNWPLVSQITLLLLAVMGGCAGSTGGGMKVIRIMILGKTAIHSIKNTASPRRVFSVKSDGKTLEDSVVKGTAAYLAVYVFFIAVSVFLISFDNKDFGTTFTSVLTTVNNVGPGLGEISPSGNFSGFSGFSKIVLIIDMLAGRLELYPILILFSRHTWRRS